MEWNLETFPSNELFNRQVYNLLQTLRRRGFWVKINYGKKRIPSDFSEEFNSRIWQMHARDTKCIAPATVKNHIRWSMQENFNYPYTPAQKVLPNARVVRNLWQNFFSPTQTFKTDMFFYVVEKSFTFSCSLFFRAPVKYIQLWSLEIKKYRCISRLLSS